MVQWETEDVTERDPLSPNSNITKEVHFHKNIAGEFTRDIDGVHGKIHDLI